jgi:hypothetical protein
MSGDFKVRRPQQSVRSCRGVNSAINPVQLMASERRGYRMPDPRNARRRDGNVRLVISRRIRSRTSKGSMAKDAAVFNPKH